MGGGPAMEVGQVVWSKFLLECQWFELGGVFGREGYAFFEDALASGGLLRRSPYVNKVQHLFYGRMTSKILPLHRPLFYHCN